MVPDDQALPRVLVARCTGPLGAAGLRPLLFWGFKSFPLSSFLNSSWVTDFSWTLRVFQP